MAVFQYRKFKVSLHPDTKKSQGLQTGDIVRRQYFDGQNLIYSLMCVLSYGTDETVNAETNEVEERPYFIGALLEGDAPQTDEILDFARITNLFNEERSGALYLTSSDDQAPYMDVIDGIGRNASLCWPESIGGVDYQDPTVQYIPVNRTGVTLTYTPSYLDNSRIFKIAVGSAGAGLNNGIVQNFYQFVANPNRVLISYKVRANKACTGSVSLGYINEVHTDGSESVAITTDWTYHFHAITVEWSGRHLRNVKLITNGLGNGDWMEIADFNIILLSSVTNFKDASQIRVGKLNGITDPIFGKIRDYGGYFQKLFVTGSAHISGTLTAGDENGFSSTFYAGKIHRNVFINSLDVDFSSNIMIDQSLVNPTGVGYVYLAVEDMIFTPQVNEWLTSRIGKLYTFSFWGYAKSACVIYVRQNNKAVGTITIPYSSAHKWVRHSVTFELQEPEELTDDMELKLHFEYTDYDHNSIGASSATLEAEAQIIDGHSFYFTAPQLESGRLVTQYQPTDEILNDTEDYGAWFSRGGIGGTIQNPLLKLNMDGNGSIGTRTNSFLLRTDGSGYFANMNISWDQQGRVTFGDQVTLNWNNLSNTIQQQMISKSIKITGPDCFNLLGDESSANTQFSPQSITLTMTEENLSSTSSQRKWYYLNDGTWTIFSRQNAKTLTILPDGEYWNGQSVLTVKCGVTIGGNVYTDSFTIRKQYILGYTIKVSSTKGESFKNGVCATVLQADVYYQGKLVDPTYVADNFTFVWKKYHLPDTEHEVQGWWEAVYDENEELVHAAIDRTARTITLDYQISGSDLFICELQNGSSVFPYTFPIIF